MPPSNTPSKEMGSAGITARPVTPASTRLPNSIGETANVINAVDLEANGGSSARSSNLAFGNTVVSTNLSHQNATANQQRLNQLNLATLGKTVNRVSNIQPTEARSAVDVLTSDEVASALADLASVLEAFSGGGVFPPPGGLIKFIEQAIKVLQNFIETQEAFTGDGTYDNPVKISRTPPQLFITLPFQIGFKGLSPSQVNITTNGDITS